MGKVEAFVDEVIKGHKVVIFSKTYCPYCTRAKNLFAELQVQDVIIIELDTREDGSEIQAYLAKITGQRTVPNIFIHGKHVGGCDSVMALHKGGQLTAILAHKP